MSAESKEEFSLEKAYAMFKQIFQDVGAKSEMKMDSGAAMRALYVAVMMVHASPKFQNMILLKVDGNLQRENITRVAKDELQVIDPMITLAKAAYNNGPETLKDTLQAQNYVLMRHDPNVDIGKVSHYIAYHPTNKELLIGVKGTSSMEDAITDVVAVTMPHECLPNCPFTGKKESRPIRGHEGMLRAAITLAEDVNAFVEYWAEPLQLPIKIVGHSLGAGVAALLAVLLRAKFTYLQDPSKLHAYCIATPAVLDTKACAEATPFITSVVNDNDIVPRASLGNLQIIFRGLELINGKMKEQGMDTDFALMKESWSGNKRKDAINEGQFEEIVTDIRDIQQGVPIDDPDHMYVPGRIIFMYSYMTEEPPEGSPPEERKLLYNSALLDGHHSALRVMNLTQAGVSDHMLGAYQKSMDALLGKPPTLAEEG